MRAMIWATAAVLALQFALAWLVLTDVSAPGPAGFAYVGVEALGDTTLCPGDVLRYRLDMRYQVAGVYEVDVSLWRVTPPLTVIASTARRVVIAEPTELQLDFAWTVPDGYISAQTGETLPLEPGLYERHHAVTTSSRSTQPAIVTVPFVVMEGCE